MKVQAISLVQKFQKQNIKKQMSDALSVYKQIGLPVVFYIGADIVKEKLKVKSNFCDKIGL